ncbi:MAG TPA: serine hydrolase [Gemmatimonadaceae bacterium]|nr:serine hydrolase [Gemmatimonadaceae bacterium]
MRPRHLRRTRRALLLPLLLAACGQGDAAVRDAAVRAADSAAVAAAPARVVPDEARLARAYERAAELPRLRSLLVQWRDTLRAERYFHGARRDAPANIKSASKSVVSALVGIALADGELRSLDQTVGELLPADSRGLEAEKRAITVEDLLTMRAGLESTSFGNYGPWVSSRDWVRDALRRPMVAPTGSAGGPMIYSTGSSHLLSAILTRATGTSTYRFADRRLFRPLGIRLRPWTTDPRGIYFGGNEMRLTPREMLAFGALYLNRGRAPDGRQVVPERWVDSSWVPRTTSPWNGHGYGYGWWHREVRGRDVHFAWGYGGQYIFVVPSLRLVVVTTSDPNAATRDGTHLDAIHSLVADEIMPAYGG